MEKIFVKRLHSHSHLWTDTNTMEDVRSKLNGLGFYVLHGPTDDCLDVYAIRYTNNELEWL